MLGAPVELRAPDHGGDLSYATGELGVGLAARDHERVERAASACIESSANELLYGSAGALVAAVLRGEGYLAISRGGPQRAIESFEEALVELRGLEGEHRDLAAELEAGIGRARIDLGQHAEAKRALVHALAEFKALDPAHPAIQAVLSFLRRLSDVTRR